MTHTMDVGAGWTQDVGAWQISNANQSMQTDTTDGLKLVSTDVGLSDFRAHLKIKRESATGGYATSLAFRIVDVSNLWRFTIIYETGSAAIIDLIERSSGSEIVRATKAWVPQHNNYIYLDIECNGDVIKCWVDGGYGLTYTSTFNNTATKVGMVEQRGGYYTNLVFDNFEVLPLPVFPISRVGTVISETGSDEVSNAQEISVIYDGNAQILTGDVFKAWYVHGFATPYINYAESYDGITWTKYGSNPVLSGHNHPIVRKFGSIFYFYSANTANTQIDLYTSTDGINWTLDTTDVIPLGSSGDWDDTGFGNVEVWQASTNDWRMLYEAHTDWGTSGTWKIGYATSSNGRSWSKSGSNPVLELDGSCGGPWITKIGIYYYLWLHRSSSGGLPTSIARYRSTNLTTWTPWPEFTEIHRFGVGEGEDSYIGQVADVEICVHEGVAYIYFSASSNGNSDAGHMHIVLATADSRIVGGW